MWVGSDFGRKQINGEIYSGSGNIGRFGGATLPGRDSNRGKHLISGFHKCANASDSLTPFLSAFPRFPLSLPEREKDTHKDTPRRFLPRHPYTPAL